MNSIRHKLTDAQVNDVLSLAARIERVAAMLNLSMRNHASPYIEGEVECETGDVSIPGLDTQLLMPAPSAGRQSQCA